MRFATERLVVLTPDHEEPPVLDAVNDDRVVWASFDDIINAVESLLARDPGSTEQSLAVLTEREAFLLRELIRFLYEEEELVSRKDDRVLIVGGAQGVAGIRDVRPLLLPAPSIVQTVSLLIGISVDPHSFQCGSSRIC